MGADMIEMTVEEIAESMKNMPQNWAELYLEQAALIADLEEMIEGYQTRIAMLLKDPEELNH